VTLSVLWLPPAPWPSAPPWPAQCWEPGSTARVCNCACMEAQARAGQGSHGQRAQERCTIPSPRHGYGAVDAVAREDRSCCARSTFAHRRRPTCSSWVRIRSAACSLVEYSTLLLSSATNLPVACYIHCSHPSRRYRTAQCVAHAGYLRGLIRSSLNSPTSKCWPMLILVLSLSPEPLFFLSQLIFYSLS
jgi:hypothetical protein